MEENQIYVSKSGVLLVNVNSNYVRTDGSGRGPFLEYGKSSIYSGRDSKNAGKTNRSVGRARRGDATTPGRTARRGATPAMVRPQKVAEARRKSQTSAPQLRHTAKNFLAWHPQKFRKAQRKSLSRVPRLREQGSEN